MVGVQSMGEMGKDFCPNVLQPFLENIDRRSCNDGSRELIPAFHNPHRKCRPSPSAVARTLLGRVEWEEGKTSSDQYPKCQKYLEDGNQVSPKSSQLQSLFVEKVTHVGYQPYD